MSLSPAPAVEVWSHRGRVDSSPSYVDNTAGAVANALLAGADGVEIDTWSCADGVFVLTHDRDSPAGPVDRCPAPALEHLDRLDDILLAARRGTLDIELKVPPDSSPAEQARLGEALASHLDGLVTPIAGRGTDVVVSSFSAVATRQVLATGLGLRVGHLCTDVPTVRGLEDLADCGYWGVHFLASPGSLEKVPSIRSAALAGVAWTVNDPELAAALVDFGIDVIISDAPLAVRRRIVSR